ncbi:MAG: NADH-ubiquinone oxidoreductase-F iron-sulfur binding region domain-containing protein [Planctomycetota bacterium]
MHIKSVQDLERRREEAIRKRAAIKKMVLVCGGTGCMASGAGEVAKALREELAKRGIPLDVELTVKETGCHGCCERGPIVTFEPAGIFYQRVKPADVPEIVEQTVLREGLVRKLLYKDPETGAEIERWKEIPFYARQTRIALKNVGQIDPTSLDDFLAAGGFAGAIKALRMTPAQVIDIVDQSGIRGRGGAGFPTARKWKVCAAQKSDKRYLIANGDEGDPGAFMDGYLMEGDPFSVIEGMMIAAHALGSDEAYIYVRQEYPMAVKRLQNAIRVCYEAGLLGKNILETGFNLDIRIDRGGGAFVCGEETALIASIEGRRGMPQPRPPYPAVKGLWGKPTIIQNVETLGTLPRILENGAAWFASFGTAGSKGTKSFSLVGKVRNTGLIEVPMGITLREIVFDIGGGIPNGKKLKAVQTGGPSGGTIPAEMIDLPVDYDSLTQAGSIMGSGGMIVLDEDTCAVDIARYFISFTQEESCGKCAPCRVGTRAMLTSLERISGGAGSIEDVDRLGAVAHTVKDGSLCGLGQTAPNPVLTTLRYFHQEYVDHVQKKQCGAFVCNALMRYYIDAERCVGCAACARVCAVQGIRGEKDQPHSIDQDTCTQCGSCFTVCPDTYAAVYRVSGEIVRHEPVREKKKSKASKA